MSLRARIVLLAAQGLQNKDIAQALGVGRVQVARWRERDLQHPQCWAQCWAQCGVKVSRDPKFVEKLEDIVGTHLGGVAEQGRTLLPRHIREPLAPGGVQTRARTRDCHR